MTRIKKIVKIILDKVKGLDFELTADVEKYGYDSNVVYRSSSSASKYLNSMFNDLCITKEDCILDVGCGKGGAMRIMLDYPFKNVDGIELVREISTIATKNFKGNAKVSIVNIDATKFNSYGKYNYIYFYNPFPSDILKKVILKILSQCSDNVKIIYNKPSPHELLVESFDLVGVYDTQWSHSINIYKRK